MPASLTLTNIPDAIYLRLIQTAELNRRSLNAEAIVCLESVLAPNRIDAIDRLARVRKLRASLNKAIFKANDIQAEKLKGRK